MCLTLTHSNSLSLSLPSFSLTLGNLINDFATRLASSTATANGATDEGNALNGLVGPTPGSGPGSGGPGQMNAGGGGGGGGNGGGKKKKKKRRHR